MRPGAGAGVTVWGLSPPLRDLPTSARGPGRTHFSRMKTGNPAQVGPRTGSPAFGRVRGTPRPPKQPPDPTDMVHGQVEDPSGSGGWRTRLSRICLGSDTTMPTGDPFPALRVASLGDLCPLIYAGHSLPRSRSPSQRPSPRDGQILPTPRFTTPPPLTCPEPAWPARRRRRPQKTWRDLASLPRGWPLPTATPRLPDPSRPRPRWRPRGFPGPPRGKGDSRAPIRKMVERKASACPETSLDHQDLPLRNMAAHTRPLRTTVN